LRKRKIKKRSNEIGKHREKLHEKKPYPFNSKLQKRKVHRTSPREGHEEERRANLVLSRWNRPNCKPVGRSRAKERVANRDQGNVVRERRSEKSKC